MDGGPLPSIDSLRCFVAVAEHLSFRRAAAVVALTPGALSQRIKQLEDSSTSSSSIARRGTSR